VVESDNKPDTPDFISLHGVTKSGTALAITIRGGKPFKNSPALDWRLYGEKGEIRVSSSQAFLQFTVPDMMIEVHDFESDEIEVVEIKGREFDGFSLATPADNVGRAYEAIAEVGSNCTFEDAVERHRLLDAMFKENGYVQPS
jgi:predicted dehydrogenase